MADPDIKDIKRRMDGAIDALRREFAGLRTGRASIGLLEPITVEAYGSETPLNQVGTISVPEPRMITVQVWDRSLASAVEKAIRVSGLGLNPAGEQPASFQARLATAALRHGEALGLEDLELLWQPGVLERHRLAAHQV